MHFLHSTRGAVVSTAPTKQEVHQPSSHCILPQNSQNSQKPLAEISSHRCHRCAQILLTEIFSHGLHRTHRILAPSMCNYRRVWHPCHTHADTKLSSHRSHRTLRKIFSHRFHRCAQIRRVWHPCHTHADTKLSSHRSLRSQTICVHLCHLWENYQVGGVGMAGCHTLLSVFCGQYTHPKLLWVPCILWENTHPLRGKKTQRGHGGMPCPLTLVMWMRGYGKDAIPSYDYLTSTFLTLPSAVRTMFRPFWSLLSLTPLTVKNSTSPSATVVALMPVSGSLGAVQSLSTTLT